LGNMNNSDVFPISASPKRPNEETTESIYSTLTFEQLQFAESSTAKVCFKLLGRLAPLFSISRNVNDHWLNGTWSIFSTLTLEQLKYAEGPTAKI
jgi:hypothetical protein